MKPQFTLRSLLVCFMVLALSLGVCGLGGIVVATWILGLAAAIRYAKLRDGHRVKKTRSFSLGELVVVVGIIALAIVFLPPQIACVTPSMKLAICQGSLQQIGKAFREYQDAHGTLPPLREDKFQGHPLASWRVLILPYLEQEALFQRYRQTEVWNSPENCRLSDAESIPSPYWCRAVWTPESKLTQYVAVLGPDGDWLPPAQPEKDGLNPVRVVEVCDSGIHWMEPRDLSLESIGRRIPGTADCGLSSKHVIPGGQYYHDRQPGAHALFADGSVRLVPPGVPTDLLRAALQGDRAKQAQLESYGTPARPKWRNWAALWCLIGCTVLLWGKAVRDRWRLSSIA